jgi:hypothetical protein
LITQLNTSSLLIHQVNYMTDPLQQILKRLDDLEKQVKSLLHDRQQSRLREVMRNSDFRDPTLDSMDKSELDIAKEIVSNEDLYNKWAACSVDKRAYIYYDGKIQIY